MSVAIALSLLLGSAYGAPSQGREPESQRQDTDVMLNALTDEMKRSISSLKYEQHQLPYFVSYWAKELDETTITSNLGSEADVDYTRNRCLLPTVRIGDYDLDSTMNGTSDQRAVTQIPLDDDYTAIRKAVWMATDKTYKFSIRTFEWKKAYLRSVHIPDRLPDMVKVDHPSVSVAPKLELKLDESRWRGEVQKLSALFKQYPTIQSSKVTVDARMVTNWFVNSEGTRLRYSTPVYAVRYFASGQASDGMRISDYDVVASRSESDLPTYSEFEAKIKSFAERTTKMIAAPLSKEYAGPVLLKGQAAAEFFSQVLGPTMGLAEEYIGNENWHNPLKNVVGRRVLPEYMSISDDPTKKEFDGKSLIGGYEFDDEGVPAEKVELIVDGKLKDFCQSRLPTHHSKRSNGHSMGGHGVFSILEVTTNKPASESEFKDKIASLAKEAGLDYVLVIEKLNDDYQMGECPSLENTTRRFDTPSYTARPSDPTVVYRQYLDGRKEYVRGLEFNSVNLRSFRDIQAVGSDSAPYVVEPNDYTARHLITPSFLMGELDFRIKKPEHATLPDVASPLVEK
jgi:Predicted Zn-dependent proteases and their inactivated homologs